VGARIEGFNLSLDSGKGGSGGDAVNNDLLPDLILSEAVSSRNGGSDSLLNGKAVVFEDSRGWGVLLGDQEDVMVGGEFNVGNQLLLDCCIHSIADGEVVGVIR